MNAMLIIKFSSTPMQGERKLCEHHTIFFHWWINHINNQMLLIVSKTFVTLFLIVDRASKIVEVKICFVLTHDIS